ncbi:hypothetical protein ACODT5_22040 [Streptomyces sp. 5.8]|uniref:hypothetical protein n=1 Tax=Streptomyces sp. 5.8 TaxID=3406571 RepID=UPI003BB520C4
MEREWLNEDGRRIRVIVTAEMAEFTDEELRLCFEARHGVPRQGRGSAKELPGRLPEEGLGSGLDDMTRGLIAEVTSWLAAQDGSGPGAGRRPLE